MDIQINDNSVLFHKKLWHESEVLLGRCFNFDVDIDTGVIEAKINQTAKRSLFEFIKLAFRNFSESPLEEDRRNKFYEQLTQRYTIYNTIVGDEIKKKLPYADKFYKHQGDTLKESYFRKHNFYALDMGMGKTIISASMSRLHQCKRTAIFCPAAVKFNWFADLKSFGFNELYFSIMDSRKSRNIRAFNERFVILNYDIINNFSKELLSAPIDHFIFDEAHALKNHNTQRYKNLAKIVAANPGARITFLSGSPIKNRVNDMFAYLKLIGHELGSSYKRFLDEYTISTTGSRGTQIKGGRNLQDLQVKMSNLMIRKTKEQCLDLPEKIFLQYKYEMADYRAEYDKVIEELSQQKSISSLTGNLHSLNIITSKAKIPGIIEIAENIIEEGRKVVIFGGYTDPIETLAKHFGSSCVVITGSVDSFTRQQYVEKFHNDPECKVFIGNMLAAGVGINLTNSSDVIFINFPFSPADLYQAMDRLHRIGQKSSVNVHYTFCEDSVDEHIYEIIMDKEKDIVALIDKGKEVMIRDNITQILISKLLNKNVDIEIPVSEVDKQEEAKEVEENIFARKNREKLREASVKDVKESVSTDVSIDIGRDVSTERTSEDIMGDWITKEKYGTTEPLIQTNLSKEELLESYGITDKKTTNPKYYVVLDPPQENLFISNESQIKYNLEGGCEIIFENEDPQQCIIHGTHHQLTKDYEFDRNYIPNSIVEDIPLDENIFKYANKAILPLTDEELHKADSMVNSLREATSKNVIEASKNITFDDLPDFD